MMSKSVVRVLACRWRAGALAVMSALALAPAAIADEAHGKPPDRGDRGQTNGLALTAPTWTKLATSSQSHPFNGDRWMVNPVGLSKYGYTEDEYLVSGTARVYESVPNSDYAVKAINQADYTTRALVRRPKDMRRWSGHVVVEYLNATDGWGAPINWRALWQELIQSNDVYVGFLGKPNGIPPLQQFDAKRYASLSMPNPVPAAQQTCGSLPTDPDYNPNLSKLYENGLLWDIWSGIGLSLKSDDSPLGRAANDLWAIGESQSTFAMYTYYSWFGGDRTTVNGEPVYDGNLGETGRPARGPAVTGALNQCETPLPTDDPQARVDVMPDHGTPFFAVNSQWDVPVKPPPPSRNYRLWTLTGADHVDVPMFQWMWPSKSDLTKARLAGPAAFPWQITYGATYEAFSPAGWWCDDTKGPEVGLPQAERQAYILLKRWANSRKAPPVAPYLARNPDGSLIRDADGNATGGLRLPYMQVPIASYLGTFWGDCEVDHAPFSAARLAQLYPTQDDYVSKVSAAAEDSYRRGYLRREDAIDMIARAADRPIP